MFGIPGPHVGGAGVTGEPSVLGLCPCHSLVAKSCPTLCNPHSTPLGCHRAPDLSSLRHTANSHWLSILHMVSFLLLILNKSLLHIFHITDMEKGQWGIQGMGGGNLSGLVSLIVSCKLAGLSFIFITFILLAFALCNKTFETRCISLSHIFRKNSQRKSQ